MLQTSRLRLRNWLEGDLEPFAKLNADPDVMRYFERHFSREETEVSIGRFQNHIDEHGFGFWAAECIEGGDFVGFVGMQHVSPDMAFAPAVEIGWRLDKSVWGQGLAPEGARACLAFAFSRLALDEVVSFTAKQNTPSRRVMEKIGMAHDRSGDFDHPKVSDECSLKRHVLYSIRANQPVFA